MFKTIGLTLLAMIAFAGNSVVCRLALQSYEHTGASIDAMSFTAIRLASGAFVLMLLMLFFNRSYSAEKSSSSLSFLSHGNWVSAFCLYAYALTFSFAYISLDTASGALILFTAVQITMLTSAALNGERFSFSQWLALGIAFCGFVYFVMPSLFAVEGLIENNSSLSAHGIVLMIVSGIAWGVYSTRGQKKKMHQSGSRKIDQPPFATAANFKVNAEQNLPNLTALASTSANFIYSVPFVALTLVIYWWLSSEWLITSFGLQLALISGVATSAIGYTIWYLALPALSSLQASMVQLTVPIIAAIGGVLFAAEFITQHLVLSSLLILLPVAFVLKQKH